MVKNEKKIKNSTNSTDLVETPGEWETPLKEFGSLFFGSMFFRRDFDLGNDKHLTVQLIRQPCFNFPFSTKFTIEAYCLHEEYITWNRRIRRKLYDLEREEENKQLEYDNQREGNMSNALTKAKDYCRRIK